MSSEKMPSLSPPATDAIARIAFAAAAASTVSVANAKLLEKEVQQQLLEKGSMPLNELMQHFKPWCTSKEEKAKFVSAVSRVGCWREEGGIKVVRLKAERTAEAEGQAAKQVGERAERMRKAAEEETVRRAKELAAAAKAEAAEMARKVATSQRKQQADAKKARAEALKQHTATCKRQAALLGQLKNRTAAISRLERDAVKRAKEKRALELVQLEQEHRASMRALLRDQRSMSAFIGPVPLVLQTWPQEQLEKAESDHAAERQAMAARHAEAERDEQAQLKHADEERDEEARSLGQQPLL